MKWFHLSAFFLIWKIFKSCLSGSFCYRYYLLPGGQLMFSVYDFLMKFFCLWFDLWAFYTWLTSILYSEKHWILLPTIILFQGHMLDNVILCWANFSRSISLQVLRKKKWPLLYLKHEKLQFPLLLLSSCVSWALTGINAFWWNNK